RLSRTARSSYVCLCFHSSAPPRYLHSFPTRRSSDLQVVLHNPVGFGDASTLIDQPRQRIGVHVMDLAAAQRSAGRDQFITCNDRSEEHTSELQSRVDLVCRLLLEKKKRHQRLPSSAR